MAQIDLGKLKFQWKGLYFDSTAYEVDDVVHYDGSTYTVTSAVPSNNTSRPGVNAAFALMARGLKFRGAYQSNTTYLHNEVVTYDGASWISLQSASFQNQTPQSGSAYWEVLTPAPASNVLTTPGDLVYTAKDGVTSRLPIGSKDATLTVIEDPDQTFARGFTYSVGSLVPATGIATDLDTALVVGTNAVNAAIKVTRGRTYSITFPANGKTYSVKDPASGSYTTLGSGGRLASGTNPAFISNGGTLLFSPDSSTPNTVVIRDELGGTDVITVTVRNMSRVPSWSGANSQRALGRKLGHSQFNTMTSGVLPLSSVSSTYGRGNVTNTSCIGYRTGSYLSTNGKVYSWGNFYNNATQGNYYNAMGLGQSLDGSYWQPAPTVLRLPAYYNRALAGDSAEAKWLTDLNGNALGAVSRETPKIIDYVTAVYNAWFITENGMLFGSGYDGYGIMGNGTTIGTKYAAMPVQLYDSSGTALTGANRPKVRQVFASNCGDCAGTANAVFALDTDGKVYAWGYNNYGQLGDGTTTTNYFARQIPQTFFNSEKVVFITTASTSYCSAYAITETGKCFAWGFNGAGSLGINNFTSQTRPTQVTAVSGSPLNGKKVIHVMCADGDAGNTKTWFLTDEGKIYAAGIGEAYGQYLGVYSSTSANQALPVELTNAATTINSGSQKVVSIWTSGGRYPSCYAITDGGTSAQPKVYSWGNNAYGQLGRGAGTASTASAVAQGDWFLAEIQFQDFGNTELSGGISNSRPGEIRGQTMYSASWTSKMRFGRPVAIFANGMTTTTQQAIVLLDDLGQAYICGYWGYTPTPYLEMDNLAYFESSNNYTTIFTPVFSQPEPLTDWGFLSTTTGEEGWVVIGKSGTVYTGGYSGWNATGNTHASLNGSFLPVMVSTL